MPHKIRSRSCPLGILGLPPNDARVVSIGNCLSRRAAALIKRAAELKIPGFEENLAHSFLHEVHGRPDRGCDPRFQIVYLHQCGYGALTRKATRLDRWWRDGQHLAKQCTCFEKCTFSGNAHCRLAGLFVNVFRITQAAQYPRKFASVIANTVDTAIFRRQKQKSWSLFPSGLHQ